MTVGELIEELEGYGTHLPVRICVPTTDFSDEDNYDEMSVCPILIFVSSTNDFMEHVVITVELD